MFGQNGSANGCPDDAFSTKPVTGIISNVINLNLSTQASGVFFHALSTNSPAIDAIDFVEAGPLISCRTPSYDQRNVARPTDGNNNGSLACDIGAIEGSSSVISLNDFTDVIADDGKCTLREAVLAANTGTPSGDTAGECKGGPEIIRLGANSVYTLENTALEIRGNVTIEGNGSTLLQSKAGQRAFIVYNGGNLSVKNTTLRGTRTLNLVIQPFVYDPALAQAENNEPTDALETNSAETITAALDTLDRLNAPEVLHVRTALESNQPELTFGGGGMIVLPGGTANVLNTSITHFGTDGSGGGIVNYGTLNLANSTLSDNIADDSGGGVYNVGTAFLSHVTIAQNIADADKNGTGNGGGLANSGEVIVRNSIIAQNTDLSTSGDVHDDVSLVGGSIKSGGRNVVGIDAGATSSFIASDVRGTAAAPLNPFISSLIGTPPRHLLLLGSPALERIPAASCTFVSEVGNPFFQNGAKATTDQTGNPRPIDYNGNGTATCDAGAVEMSPAVRLPMVIK